jgi:Transposase IS66 family
MCGKRPSRRLPKKPWIGAVYAIEDKARFAPAAERVEHRRQTAPLLEAFFIWANTIVLKLSGKLELAKAFRYTITRREALTRFLTDGRLEVDTNIAENAMRGIALGRRIIYSLDRIAVVSGQHPSTPWWRRQSSTV